MVGQGDLPGGQSGSNALGVSADGSVVVGRGHSTASGLGLLTEAFRWTSATGMVGLGDIPGGNFNSEAYAAPGSGATVVGVGSRTTSSLTEAFRWTPAGGMVGLGSMPGGSNYSAAFDASADGNLVVGFSSNGQFSQAATWSLATGWLGLGVLPGHGSSRARAVSSDGQVIVGWSTGSGEIQAFRWTLTTGMLAQGDLPGGETASFAFDLSDDGSVIVGFGVSDSGGEATIWDPMNGMRSLRTVLSTEYGLNVNGWSLTQAYGISGDGRVITGYGVNPSGQTEAWVAVIPEPNTLILLILGVAGFQYSCNRKKRR
ncbi:MAG: PEP-CTERM sorting domain-containing protein [Phycisphaerae bacterium]|nr:PEP-CTERM sorting domain-containing protein [Phycisphaerae bacterium]